MHEIADSILYELEVFCRNYSKVRFVYKSGPEIWILKTPNRSETARESPCLYTFSRRLRPGFAMFLYPLSGRKTEVLCNNGPYLIAVASK